MHLADKSSLKLNMLVTLVIWCVLGSVSMVGMLVVAADKTIVIEDAPRKEGNPTLESQQSYVQWGKLEILENENLTKEFCIPLGQSVKAEHVTVENKYMERELWIYIKTSDTAFYQQNQISGDASLVQKSWYELQKDGIVLKLHMEDLWEYRSTMETGNLKIAVSSPGDIYKHIVVVDVFGGGDETGITANGLLEKDIALQVAKLVPQKVTQPEIKVYITRSEDASVSKEARMALVKAVEPDLFVQIKVSEAPEDTAQYGILAYYNEEYFIPELGNVEWADRVTKAVTVAAGNRALGLFPVGEDSILKTLDMPAAAISIGYLTNAQESTLLSQTTYQEKLASGIAKAIEEAYK